MAFALDGLGALAKNGFRQFNDWQKGHWALVVGLGQNLPRAFY
jgi:hypothetical protein